MCSMHPHRLGPSSCAAATGAGTPRSNFASCAATSGRSQSNRMLKLRSSSLLGDINKQAEPPPSWTQTLRSKRAHRAAKAKQLSASHYDSQCSRTCLSMNSPSPGARASKTTFGYTVGRQPAASSASHMATCGAAQQMPVVAVCDQFTVCAVAAAAQQAGHSVQLPLAAQHCIDNPAPRH